MKQLALRTASLRDLIGRFRRKKDGVVMIEFALVLPILVVLLLGLAEFTEAFSVNRKLAASAGASGSSRIGPQHSVTTFTEESCHTAVI